MKKILKFLMMFLAVFLVASCGGTKLNEVNYFLEDECKLNKDYTIKATKVENVDTAVILTKNNETIELNSKYSGYIKVYLTITNINDNKHKLSTGDFKLKDHSNFSFIGIKFSKTYSEKKFKTQKALEDYTWANKVVEKTENIEIYFENTDGVDVSKDLTILEFDTSYSKKGIDIVLINKNDIEKVSK